MSHPIYHLELIVRRCRAELTLNGFPLMSLTSQDERPVSFAPPINPYLAGMRNAIEITLRALLSPDGTPIPFSENAIEGNVRRFSEGDIVAPGTGELVVQFSTTKETVRHAQAQKFVLPIPLNQSFVNEAVDFSQELFSGPVFDHRDALVDYALHLRALAITQDTDALLREWEPKSRVWSAAYDIRPAQGYQDSLRQSFDEFFGGKPLLNFERKDIELLPCCGMRIWKLSRAQGEPLLASQLTDGSTIQFPIYAAPRNGQLHIVR